MRGVLSNQCDIYSILATKEPVKREVSFEEKIQGLSFDEKIIAYTNPWLINRAYDMCDRNENPYDCYAEVKKRAATRRQLYAGGHAEIWSYDKPKEKWNIRRQEFDEYTGKMLTFRLGNEVIAQTFAIDNIYTDKICFPAMCMVYVDAEANPLPYTIRDNFIENGLGLLKHGTYRLGKIKKGTVFSFCSMETTLGNIIRHLKDATLNKCYI
jgi:hypothetical protein